MDSFDRLYLYTGPDYFYFESQQNSRYCLFIDRNSQDISLRDRATSPPPQDVLRREILGLLGVIHLISGPYLVVLSRRSRVSNVYIAGHEIWRADSFELLPFSRNTLHLTAQQVVLNRTYETMLETALGQPFFYYSPTADLTHSLQQQSTSLQKSLTTGASLVELADPLFLWNRHLVQQFEAHVRPAVAPELRTSLLRFIVPVIHGYIGVETGLLGGTAHNERYIYALISRRSIERAGTRYHTRGVDSAGNVANFVETEQILLIRDLCYAFVQVRGSVPVQWMQTPDLYYTPEFKIQPQSNQQQAFQLHLEFLRSRYGRQTCLSLLNFHGRETILRKKFVELFSSLANQEDFRLEEFDFHAECKRHGWSRLNVLVERLASELERFHYLMGVSDTRVEAYLVPQAPRSPALMGPAFGLLSQQLGTVRTNCIDCLDRTNVVQSLLARRVLQSQLRNSNILQDSQTIDSLVNLESTLKRVWTENGDNCSKQYASTGAQKTDFTRTGKRTTMGKVMDFIKSIVRYYKNNFSDGFKQDAVNLLLGHYIVDPNEGHKKLCPIAPSRSIRFYALLFVLLFSFGMCVLSFSIAEHLTLQLGYLLFWVACLLATVFIIMAYSREFVDLPRLQRAKHD